jgi:hypothetical protein
MKRIREIKLGYVELRALYDGFRYLVVVVVMRFVMMMLSAVALVAFLMAMTFMSLFVTTAGTIVATGAMLIAAAA